jgi:FixJ family two-component response regulator
MQTSLKNTSLYIVDDEAAIRDALALLTSMAGFSVSVFSNAEDFLTVIDTDSTGCVILDIYLGGMSGLQVLKQVKERAPNLACIVITAHGDVHTARQAFLSGAVDFIEKPYDPQELMNALQAAKLRVSRQPKQNSPQSSDLTPREAEVRNHLLLGKSNKEIASLLQISPRTVEVHKSRVLEKLGQSSVIDLIRSTLLNG